MKEQLASILKNSLIPDYFVEPLAEYLSENGVVIPVRCGECVECYNEGNFGADGFCSEGKRREDNG